MGERSCVCFPFGDVLGEQWIEIGRDTLVAPLVCLAAGMPGERLDPTVAAVIVIGDRCTIGRGTSIVARCEIVIEDDVITGPNVYVTDHNHDYRDLDSPISAQWPVESRVHVGRGSWLGAGVTVLPGAVIGSHVTVAAGSVVKGHLPDNSVAAGSPAKVVRRFVDGSGWLAVGEAPDDGVSYVWHLPRDRS
jgi:carbonic anhydrase/acetyltransferase-like protein (isoleucine patch superfamily)